jgi:hypothetical protein
VTAAVAGVIESIDPEKRMLVIRDLTPLEAKIEFYYDGETRFTPVGGTPRAMLGGTGFPLRADQRVQVEWTSHPANKSRKMALAITEQR